MARVKMPHPFTLRVDNGFEVHLRQGLNDVDDKYAGHWVIKKFLVDGQNAPVEEPAAEVVAPPVEEPAAEVVASAPGKKVK